MKTLNQPTLIDYLTEDQQIFFGFEDETRTIEANEAKLIHKINELSNNVKVSYKKGVPVLENIMRVCPKCGKRHVHKHELKDRTLHFYSLRDIEVKVYRYKCSLCNTTFMADLSSIVQPFCNFTNEFKSKLLSLIKETNCSLFDAKFTIFNDTGVSISHQTIENYILESLEPLKNDNLSCRGYLIFDVEWVKLNGTWNYRFALYDIFEKRIIAEKIYDKENNENLNEFLTESTKNITVKCITTDLAQNYKPILNNLGYNQQYCLFNTKMNLTSI